MLIPVIDEMLDMISKLEVQLVYLWCIFKPEESMYMATSMVLPFILPLIPCTCKLCIWFGVRLGI